MLKEIIKNKKTKQEIIKAVSKAFKIDFDINGLFDREMLLDGLKTMLELEEQKEILNIIEKNPNSNFFLLNERLENTKALNEEELIQYIREELEYYHIEAIQ